MRVRSLASVLTLSALAAAACSSAESPGIADPAPGLPDEPPRESGPPSAPGETDATPPDDGGKKARAAPLFASLAERCKLVNGAFLDDPTANNTHFRANLRGTDLGIPVAHDGTLYLFFGDTAGMRGIWPLGGESLPDAVGVVSHAATKASSSTLCTALRFLGGAPESSVGRTQDGRIERDFAAASMTPPPGHALAEYIHNPSGPRGANAFPHLPGDFEVPSGAFSYGGSIYVFYTTVESPSVVEMKGSYLARWNAPSPFAAPSYAILYGVDQRFDTAGPLRGDFINIAPVIVGDYLYLFGSGKYRASNIHLARKKLATLAAPGGIERFDAASRAWRPGTDATAKPIVVTPSAGELSVQYFASIQRFVMMSQEIEAGKNQIVARFADAPEGPWSKPEVVASFSDPAFVAKYCCIENRCTGERLFNCDRAGFYAPYMLPDLSTRSDGSFTIDFTMSTWDPYNVALMSATFRVPQGP